MNDQVKEDKFELQKSFGNHLVRLRESKGLTAAKLARRCYIKRSSIARLESDRTNPSLFVLKKLSIGFEMNIEGIFKGIQII